MPVAVFTNKAGVLLVATFRFPHKSNLLPGEVVPMPTLPLMVIPAKVGVDVVVRDWLRTAFPSRVRV
jgi:hypothetical protein